MNMYPEEQNALRERIIGGHVWKTVWWLSWPSIITMLLQTLNGLIDAVFVGRLGASALSGVGIASQVMLILMSITSAVAVGTTALVARFIGSNDHKSAEDCISQSVLLSIILSIAAGFATYLIGPTLIKIMGGRGDGLHDGLLYLNILLLGVTPYFLMFVLSGVYRGLGDMLTPLWISVVMTIISVVGDYVLIFGIGPFPRLGVAGAGIATNISRVVSVILFFYYLPKSHFPSALRGCWSPSWGWFRRILNIGSPAALQGLLRNGAAMAYFAILGLTPEATYAIAALTIGLRMEALAFMPGFAFSVAATAMVGQNLGARRPDRAEQSAWAATWQGVWVMGLFGLVFILFGRQIASIFTTDPRVLPLAASYLMINGISEPFFAMAVVLTGALQGAGETRLPTAVTIITMWVIRLPLTYYLAIALGMNAVGAWIAMSASTILSGLATLAAFRWSRWTETEV